MSALLVAGAVAAAAAGLAVGALTFRLLRGPSSADRAIAIDMLGLLAIVVAAVAAALTGQQAFLDVAFGIAVVGFLAAVAFAGLFERIAAQGAATPEEKGR